jgi:hypothetical protein
MRMPWSLSKLRYPAPDDRRLPASTSEHKDWPWHELAPLQPH